VAFPRSLKVVRDQALIQSAVTQAVAEPVPYIRDASAQLLTQIQRSQSYGVDLGVALQVPAFVKCLKTFTNTISAFPLKEYVGKDQVVARGVLVQPNPQTTYASIMGRTVQDLLLYGFAYWRVAARAWDGYPTEFDWMPYSQVSFMPDATTEAMMDPIPAFGTIYWNGVPVPPRDVVRFDGDSTGGWLDTMASAVNTAAALEAAALRYAEYPVPNVILKNSGADLPGAVVDDLLEAWERDGHIRNLHKVEPYGPSAVKEYITQNLSEYDTLNNNNSGTFNISKGFSLNKSIGYDPRTGKR
jgi:hypothetical protein